MYQFKNYNTNNYYKLSYNCWTEFIHLDTENTIYSSFETISKVEYAYNENWDSKVQIYYKNEDILKKMI